MSPNQLGNLLACVATASEADTHQDGISKEELYHLKQRISVLSCQMDVPTKALIIPEIPCADHHPFLMNNQDFFIIYLILSHSQVNPVIDCNRLTEHLNDCYPCFELYSQTLHAYYQAVCENQQEIDA